MPCSVDDCFVVCHVEGPSYSEDDHIQIIDRVYLRFEDALRYCEDNGLVVNYIEQDPDDVFVTFEPITIARTIMTYYIYECGLY